MPVSWLVVVIIAATAIAALMGLAWMVARRWQQDEAHREIKLQFGALSWRKKLRLAGRLVKDRRLPLAVRAIPVLLVLYLAMPIDIIPDFIPLLGQLDDVVMVAVAIALIIRFTPEAVFREHLAALGEQVSTASDQNF